MATRNFVPRANGEGKIGTPTKHWGDVYADAIHGDLSGNALSVKGGVLVGDAKLTSNADNNTIRVRSSIDGNNGGGLILRGKNTTNDSGSFSLIAQDDISSKMLFGFPDGRLLWNSNSLDKSAVVAESLGTKIGYRKYASGLIVQWRNYDESSWGAEPSQWSYPISFTSKPTVLLTGYTNSVALTEVGLSSCKAIGVSGPATGVCIYAIGH